MASLNKVLLMGNLTRDPELRYTSGGTAMVNFTLAMNRRYTSATGEAKDEACFVRVVVWGKTAENCGKYLSKGRPVFVEGSLRQNNWETDKGEKRSTLEVVAQTVQFLGSKKDSEGGGGAEGESSFESGDKDDNIPF